MVVEGAPMEGGRRREDVAAMLGEVLQSEQMTILFKVAEADRSIDYGTLIHKELNDASSFR